MIHAARLIGSRRLRDTLDVLRRYPDGVTSRDLIESSNTVAPHTDIAELRAAGFVISCRYLRRTTTGRKVYVYRLEEDNR
jgi:hypothetical protein